MENLPFTVDRIQGDIVQCQGEDGAMAQHPLAQFPENLREGDLVEQISPGTFAVLAKETEHKRAAAQSRLDALFGKSKETK